MKTSPESATENPVVQGMRQWFDGRRAIEVASRTPEQRGWDSAILAASEYVRRRTKNERFSLEIHDLLSVKLPPLRIDEAMKEPS